jgi:hypothetical protein
MVAAQFLAGGQRRAMNSGVDTAAVQANSKVSFEDAWGFILKVGVAAHGYGSTATRLESFLKDLSLADASARIDAIDQFTPPWGRFASMLGYALAALGLAPLLGGEMNKKRKMKLNAFVIGLLVVMICMPNFAQAAEQPSPNLTLISNVNIFDGKTEKLHKNMHVLVKGNLIETVSNEPLAVIQTDNVTIIEGKGRTLIADGIDEVRRAVREQLFRGASHIKIHTGGGVTSFTDPLMAAQYTPEEIKAAVEEATRYGTYVMTHSQMDNSVVESLDAGVKSIEHGLVLEESTVKRMAELGVIKEGAFADILIVNGDPTKDIRLLMDADKNIDLIMKDGKIYKNIIN